MKKVTWTIEYQSPPTALKYCKKCGCKTAFACSGRFRANARRKSLDVWLIYKCESCDTTWNAAVYTQVSPQSLLPRELDGFHGNDEQLVMDYAMDYDFLNRNNAQAGLPQYTVEGDMFSPEDEVELTIKSEYSLPVKVSVLIREKLKLSQREFSQLADSGRIRSLPESDLHKCRLNKGIVLIFSCL